jgi:hypothetical protein
MPKGCYLALALGVALAPVAVCERTAQAAAPVSAVAHDGPFGIAMGEPLADLGEVSAVQPGVSRVLHPPRTNDKLPTVAVVSFATMGVCRIYGASEPYPFDADGKLVRSLVDQLAVTLTQKYGTPTKTDTCSAPADECQDNWTTALRRKAAEYSYRWSADKSPLPPGVKTMLLTEVPYNEIKTGAVVTYFGVNDDACAAALTAAAGASL